MMQRSASFKLTIALALWAAAMSLTTSCTKKNNAGSPQAAPTSMPSNKQLTIGIQQEFDTLNPIITSMGAARYITQMSNSNFISLDADWKWTCFLCATVPSLENGLAKIIDEKGVKKILVTWEMKSDAFWGDGKPVTGQDFKTSWEIGRSPSVQVGEKDVFDRVESIEIDKTNPRKFTMKMKEARFDFYQFPTFSVVPDHIEGPIFQKTKNEVGAYEKQSEYVVNPTNPGLWNGAFLIKEVKLGSHVILERNPHFKPQAHIERIVMKLIPSTQTLEANLLSGTIDMISQYGITFDQALALEKRFKTDASLKSRFKVEIEEGLIYEHIDLNLDNPILKDIKVRKALAYSMDLDKLTQALFEGRQKKAISNMHPRDVYYTENVVKYDYDPKKAEELLEEAGWKKGSSGIREKNGKKLELVFMTTAQNKVRELVQVFLQEQWKKVGIDIAIQNEPARTFFAESMQKRKFPALGMYAWTSTPDNPPRSTLHSLEIPTSKNSYAGQNFPGWVNKRSDELIDQSRREFDINKRKLLLEQQQQLYTEELPVLSLYYRADVSVIPANLQNFKMTGHQNDNTQSIETWNLTSAASH